MNRAEEIGLRLLEWFPRHARDLPWRRTRDPYAIWISEVMLQQTQVATVIPYWERWMRELPSVSALAAASETKVLKLWEGLGYYRRARHLQAAARLIMSQCSGVFPRDFEQVLALPGVGNYTAGAICSIAFNEPTPILDGNAIRVFTRLEAIEGDPRTPPVNQKLWKVARDIVETAAGTGVPSACSTVNQAIMELGATICLPRSAACERCPVSPLCRARARHQVHAFPQAAPRVPTVRRDFLVIAATARNRWFACQRPPEVVNGSLWELPNAEVVPAERPDPEVIARRLFRAGEMRLSHLTTIRHAITKHRVVEHVYVMRLPWTSRAARQAGEWFTLEEMEALPFSSAHRRIVRELALAG